MWIVLHSWLRAKPCAQAPTKNTIMPLSDVSNAITTLDDFLVAKSGEQVRLAALTWRLSRTSPGLRESGAKSGGLTARKSD